MTNLSLQEMALLLNSLIPQNKSAITYAVNKMFDNVRENEGTFSTYMDNLLKLGLLEKDDQFYQISSKGRRALKQEALGWQLILNELLGKFYKIGYKL